MGRAPCCDKANVKKGPWSPEEDLKLKEYIEKYGTGGNWIALPQKVGLKRCGKSCRLRWLNYLRPNIKHGEFSDAEDRIICTLFASIGSRWSIIAAQLPGRTDNDIKNYWNTKLKKKLMGYSLLSSTHQKPQQHNHQNFQSLTTFTSSPSSYCLSSPLSIARSFNSGLETLSTTPVSSDLLSPPYAPTAFQPRDSTLLGSFQFQPYPEAMKENFLMFGGEAASCSSSDGSSSNNLHMSHGKDRDFEYGSEQLGLGFQSCINYQNNGADEENKLMMVPNNGGNEWTNEKPSGIWGESDPLEYYGSIEEIKQLLSGSTSNNSRITVDEIKTEEEEEEERVLMYY